MEESSPTAEGEFASRTCSLKGIEGQEGAAKCLKMSLEYLKANFHGQNAL